MKPRLLFATTNQGKLRELRGLVGDAVEVVSLKDLPPIPEPVEDGATFEENARKKARAYAEGDDRARYEKLLAELSGVADERRTAAFMCALCLALPGSETSFVEVGRCEGRIGHAPRGSHGFGYDPVFELPGGRALAELTSEEKATVSHRGAAFLKMKPRLLALAGGGRVGR